MLICDHAVTAWMPTWVLLTSPAAEQSPGEFVQRAPCSLQRRASEPKRATMHASIGDEARYACQRDGGTVACSSDHLHRVAARLTGQRWRRIGSLHRSFIMSGDTKAFYHGFQLCRSFQSASWRSLHAGAIQFAHRKRDFMNPIAGKDELARYPVPLAAGARPRKNTQWLDHVPHVRNLRLEIMQCGSQLQPVNRAIR